MSDVQPKVTRKVGRPKLFTAEERKARCNIAVKLLYQKKVAQKRANGILPRKRGRPKKIVTEPV